jgi:hypothetical protein
LKTYPNNSARFWTAAALCRFCVAIPSWKSGRELPQSKTLPRDSLNPDQFFGYRIFETSLAGTFNPASFSWINLIMMKVRLIRADATSRRGTGHVLRGFGARRVVDLMEQTVPGKAEFAAVMAVRPD